MKISITFRIEADTLARLLKGYPSLNKTDAIMMAINNVIKELPPLEENDDVLDIIRVSGDKKLLLERKIEKDTNRNERISLLEIAKRFS